jgi:hypothetical protein
MKRMNEKRVIEESPTPKKQAVELERRLNEAHEREARHRRVAEIIRSYLDSLNGQPVDLHRLGGIIRQASTFAKGEATQQS